MHSAHLSSISEQTHSNIQSICLSRLSTTVAMFRFQLLNMIIIALEDLAEQQQFFGFNHQHHDHSYT